MAYGLMERGDAVFVVFSWEKVGAPSCLLYLFGCYFSIFLLYLFSN